MRQAPDQSAGAEPLNLSVSVEELGGDGAGSGLVFGHHLCSYGHMGYVFGSGDELMESLCAGVSDEQHDGGGLLCGCLEGGTTTGLLGGETSSSRLTCKIGGIGDKISGGQPENDLIMGETIIPCPKCGATTALKEAVVQRGADVMQRVRTNKRKILKRCCNALF